MRSIPDSQDQFPPKRCESMTAETRAFALCLDRVADLAAR